MNQDRRKTKLDRIVAASLNKNVLGVVASVQSGDDSFAWTGSAGNLKPENRYFIASTTKLYITAATLKLRELGAIAFEDPIAKFIPQPILSGIHVYRGTDYSSDITIGQLLSHTSGLPDYFQYRATGGRSLLETLTAGRDRAWTFDRVMDDVKSVKPAFAPGQKGRALYSDTNFQLLGKILETVSQRSVNECLKTYVYDPLQLKDTYMYEDANDSSPVPLNYKTGPLPIPLAMTSFGADGGIVSTAAESMKFVRAFFEGKLFPKSYLQELYVWNDIFFPLQYGYGIARFRLPRVFTPFKPFPELIGHSGLSGAFSFYCPAKDVYVTGTVNEIANPSLSYKLMMKLVQALD